MVAAGETGGILEEVLERIAVLLERDEALRKSVVAALAYPATVLAASFALVVFLIVRIVPMFSSLFASFHVDLPPSTRVLLAVGDAAAQPGWWATSAVLLAFAAGVAARHGPHAGGTTGLRSISLASPGGRNAPTQSDRRPDRAHARDPGPLRESR